MQKQAWQDERFQQVYTYTAQKVISRVPLPPLRGTLSPELRPQARFGAQAALSAEMRGYAPHINNNMPFPVFSTIWQGLVKLHNILYRRQFPEKNR